MFSEHKMSKSQNIDPSKTDDNSLREDRRLKLSARDRDIFLALIDDPPEPNAALCEAVKRYRKRAENKP
jgi:uncharacterized protein (DUF1778 family)